MCKPYEFKIDFKVVNASDNDFEDLDEELKHYLRLLLGAKADKIPDLHPYLQRYIEKSLQESNVLTRVVRSSIKQSVKDNIYNFSLAKTNSFLRNLKSIKRTANSEKVVKELGKKLGSLMFNYQQQVEQYQVQHLTKGISKTEGNGDDLLIYLSENDSNVREWHLELHDTVRPKSDKQFWNLAFRALSSWNCRCEIEETEEGEYITPAPNVKPPNDISEPSSIDLETGKAILFKQDLPVFTDASPVVRREFRKSGF